MVSDASMDKIDHISTILLIYSSKTILKVIWYNAVLKYAYADKK